MSLLKVVENEEHNFISVFEIKFVIASYFFLHGLLFKSIVWNQISKEKSDVHWTLIAYWCFVLPQ